MKKFIKLTALMSLGLVLSFCSKPEAPSGKKTLRSWEQLPEISHTLLKPSFYAENNSSFMRSNTLDAKELTFNLQAKNLKATLMGNSELRGWLPDWFPDWSVNAGFDKDGSLHIYVKFGIVTFDINVHVYFNGKYVDSGMMGTKNLAYFPGQMSTPHAYSLLSNAKTQDSLYAIMDFTTKDGKHYKYTTPIFKIVK